MDAFWQSFFQYAFPMLLTAALIPGGLWLLRKAGAFLHAKTGEANQSAAAKLGFRALAGVTDLTEAVVADLNATLKAELLEASADGKITPEEGAQLKAHALERVKKVLGERGLAELAEVFGGAAETFLSAKVEQAVAATKSP